MSKWNEVRTTTSVCGGALWLTLDGGSVCKRGAEANCHRLFVLSNCSNSRIMMTYFKPDPLCLSSLYLYTSAPCITFHSSVTSRHIDGGRVWSVVMTQLRGISCWKTRTVIARVCFWTVYSWIMMTFKQTRLLSSLYLYTSAPCIRFIHLEPGTVYWDMTPRVNAWRRACLKRGALKNYLNCLTVLLYTVMYIPFGTKWWLFNFGMAQILFMD